MKRLKRPLIELRSVIATAVGGILLLLATVFLQAFVSSPPTRAEFDTLKAETSNKYDAIKDTLGDLKEGQKNIINHLLQRKKDAGK